MSVARADQTKTAILRVLHDGGGPAGASRITERLSAMGIVARPRTIRFYLMQLDKEGMTRFVSRRLGREITDRGREELAHANVLDKVGFVAAKVDTLGYSMSFSNRLGKGSIVTNVALIDKRVMSIAFKEMVRVFESGFAMGRKVAVAQAGESLGDVVVPEGHVGIGTVCSVTVNGIFLQESIPVTSRFGGLLEVRGGEPVRFVELIEYSGTTLDPLEAYIRAGMTQVRQCALTGEGLVGASFREVPSVAVRESERVRAEMERHGLSGILALGRPNRPLLDIPVAEGRAGMIVIGGLNPVAAVHEAGVRLSVLSLAGLADFGRFLSVSEASERYG